MAYANMRENMRRWSKIYAIFWDIFWAQKHIQIYLMLRSGLFSRKTRSVMVPRFGFFSRIDR